MSFIEGSEAFESEPQIEGEGTEEQLPPLSDYGKRFVENAPEEERAYAEKYVRQWDQGYAKQKQRWESELSAYREVGDPTVAKQGVALYNILLHEPERLLRHLVEERGLTVPQAQKVVQDQQEQAGISEGNGQPDPYAKRIETIEQQQQRLYQLQQEQYARQVEQQQQEQLRNDLAAAKAKFGEYDQDFVLDRIIAGRAQTVDEAVQQYQQYVQNVLKQHGRATAPNLLGGGAGSPQSQPKKKGPIPEKDVVTHLTALLEQGKHA